MNRQALTEALIDYNLRDVTPVAVPHLNPIIAAARLVERLLPGECETCDNGLMCVGGPHDHDDGCRCPVCHGSGQVWDEGIVEVVAQIIATADLALRGVKATVTEKDRDTARAVLSALVELLTEKVEEPPKDPWDYDP